MLKILHDESLRQLLWLLGMLLMLSIPSCTKHKPAPTSQNTIIYADTNRVKLQHKADQSAAELLIVQPKSQSSVTSYEQSRAQYDSIRFELH